MIPTLSALIKTLETAQKAGKLTPRGKRQLAGLHAQAKRNMLAGGLQKAKRAGKLTPRGRRDLARLRRR